MMLGIAVHSTWAREGRNSNEQACVYLHAWQGLSEEDKSLHALGHPADAPPDLELVRPQARGLYDVILHTGQQAPLPLQGQLCAVQVCILPCSGTEK